MKFARLIGIVALAVLVALPAGCAAPAQQGITLEFWTIGPEGEAVAQLLPAFEQANPGIRVRVQRIPQTAAHEKLLTAYAGDSLPDVVQIGNTWIAEFAALHALEPLQARVAHSGVVRADDYFASAWATNRVDGALYGIPWYIDTRLLFYRVDLLREAGFAAPPRDWAEWQQQMDAIRAKSGDKRWGALLPTNEYDQLLALALQQHVSLLRDGGRYGNFQSAGFKRTLSFYVGLFKRGDVPPWTNVQAGNPWQAFGRGDFVFYFSGPWNIGEFRKRLPASQQDDWSTAQLPGPGGPGDSVTYGSSLAIPRTSRHQDAAWQLVEYLSRPDVQVRFYELLGDLPARRSAWQDSTLQGDPKLRAFHAQLEHMRPTPPVPEWEQIVNMMQQVAARAVAGQLSIDQATAQMDAEAATILAKRRWVLDRQHGHAQ
ncbi:MAG: sugar ABC transporter substrate-binding protein [Xanthomonadales bacterium]|nr:sugar ABC transporter substrate-binding protein [Xanthomonadales bacterium]ODU94274.1 MAG: ABC transporter substrate-binding protein [Rhodanobacter sp. SCN 66-43]OJY86881.1 MAG: ABC transporter substrate-binding protein [Xanthomonadales bacterium 66-474]